LLRVQANRIESSLGKVQQAGLRPNPLFVYQTEDFRTWQSPGHRFWQDADHFFYLQQTFETAAKRAAKIAQEAAQRSQEEARRARAVSAHAAAAAAPQDMPRARGNGVNRSAVVDAGDDGQLLRAAPARPKNRVKQLPYHVELMGGPAGRNETETGEINWSADPSNVALW
jgi:hypothetical protein